MVNHWDRPGWTSGRSAYYWYLTFDSPSLVGLATECQSKFVPDDFDIVETDWLHLSVIKLAWSDEIAMGKVSQVVRRARSACEVVEPFSLDVGPLAGSAGAIRFSVTPWEPVVDLRVRLGNANLPSLEPTSTSPFQPHITIAYSNQVRAAGPVVSSVADAKNVPQVRINIGDVALVEVRRHGRSYKWNTVERIPLAGNG
jgi:2'-5' RNA ligase